MRARTLSPTPNSLNWKREWCQRHLWPSSLHRTLIALCSKTSGRFYSCQETKRCVGEVAVETLLFSLVSLRVKSRSQMWKFIQCSVAISCLRTLPSLLLIIYRDFPPLFVPPLLSKLTCLHLILIEQAFFFLIMPHSCLAMEEFICLKTVHEKWASFVILRFVLQISLSYW